jgi:hypothetical protein
MHSPALFFAPESPATLDQVSLAPPPAASEIFARNDGPLVLVGELRVHKSKVPVYAIRIDRSKHDSLLRRQAMRIWGLFGNRFWPCAGPDNEW